MSYKPSLRRPPFSWLADDEVCGKAVPFWGNAISLSLSLSLSLFWTWGSFFFFLDSCLWYDFDLASAFSLKPNVLLMLLDIPTNVKVSLFEPTTERLLLWLKNQFVLSVEPKKKRTEQKFRNLRGPCWSHRICRWNWTVLLWLSSEQQIHSNFSYTHSFGCTPKKLYKGKLLPN